MAVRTRRSRNERPPLDEKSLEQAALSYAGRYATTRARLTAYLSRKVRDRGWDGNGEAPVERLVEKMAELGYVDDRAFGKAAPVMLLEDAEMDEHVALGLVADQKTEAAGRVEPLDRTGYPEQPFVVVVAHGVAVRGRGRGFR